MTNEQIIDKVLEIKEALEAHKDFLESIPVEYVKAIKCFDVDEAIEHLNIQLLDVNCYLEGYVDGDDDYE